MLYYYKTKTYLSNYGRDWPTSWRGREDPTKEKPKRTQLRVEVEELFYFPEELSVISALHINPIQKETDMEMEGEEKMGRIVLALTMIIDGSVYCIVLYLYWLVP